MVVGLIFHVKSSIFIKSQRAPSDLILRAGHCMIMNEDESKLYILGGMKSKEELNDFLELDMKNFSVNVIHSGKGPGAPPYGITQRAYFHAGAKEIRIVIGSGIQGNRTTKSSKTNLGDGMISFWNFIFCKQMNSQQKISRISEHVE